MTSRDGQQLGKGSVGKQDGKSWNKERERERGNFVLLLFPMVATRLMALLTASYVFGKGHLALEQERARRCSLGVAQTSNLCRGLEQK